MDYSDSFREKFDSLNVCVIIPTYNNEFTLARVIEEVAAFSQQIIVVNDGSTDRTLEILDGFPFVHLISYKKNKGKGWALRKAFTYASEHGYQYAITIDSDGQHFAKDLPVFIDKLMLEKNAIIIGARNMNQASVPAAVASATGFQISGSGLRQVLRLPDTQSGYRLYPLEAINEMHFFTRKYEFEIEALVRAAWSGCKCGGSSCYCLLRIQRRTDFSFQAI
jgi:glycosyltransferase involved in cell wall biosynthesis